MIMYCLLDGLIPGENLKALLRGWSLPSRRSMRIGLNAGIEIRQRIVRR
jgi:hypothetical protein